METKLNAIKDMILKATPKTGCFKTSIKGLKIARRNKPSEFMKCFYNTSCILVLEGQKQMLWGDKSLVYSKGQYVVSCTDIPVASKVIKASKKEPFIVLILELDSNIISNLILETKISKTISHNTSCLAIADADEGLIDAFYRLAQLIEKPYDEVLSTIIIKEIYYRLLIGQLGSQLQLINTKDTPTNQIACAIEFLKENYDQKLNIEQMAKNVNMAPSSFYRNFKKVTGISPLQYQKQLRLYEAQRLMLTQEHNAQSASYLVGYESPTQFSREYKKMFGAPPKEDIKKLLMV